MNDGDNKFSPQRQAKKSVDYNIYLMIASSVSWTITRSPILRLVATLVHNVR